MDSLTTDQLQKVAGRFFVQYGNPTLGSGSGNSIAGHGCSVVLGGIGIGVVIVS